VSVYHFSLARLVRRSALAYSQSYKGKHKMRWSDQILKGAGRAGKGCVARSRPGLLCVLYFLPIVKKEIKYRVDRCLVMQRKRSGSFRACAELSRRTLAQSEVPGRFHLEGLRRQKLDRYPCPQLTSIEDRDQGLA